MSKLFDPASYDLACVFLDDVKGSTQKQRNDLAATIQQCIEDWLEDQDSEQESTRDMAAERDGDEARDLGYDSRFAMYRAEGKQDQHD